MTHSTKEIRAGGGLGSNLCWLEKVHENDSACFCMWACLYSKCTRDLKKNVYFFIFAFFSIHSKYIVSFFSFEELCVPWSTTTAAFPVAYEILLVSVLILRCSLSSRKVRKCFHAPRYMLRRLRPQQLSWMNLHSNPMVPREHQNNMLLYFSASVPAFRGDKGKCRHGAESREWSKPLLKARGQGPHDKEAPVQRAAFPWRESGASAQRAPYA